MTLKTTVVHWLSRLAQIRALQPLVPWAKRLLGDTRLRSLRAALPAPGAAAAGPRQASWQVDYCWHLEGLGYLVAGWCLDPGRRLESLLLRSGDASIDLCPIWVRVARKDVLEAFPHFDANNPGVGFIALARTGRAAGSVSLEGLHRDGTRRWSGLTVHENGSALHFTRTVLGMVEPNHPQLRVLIEQHLGPAITQAWASERQAPGTPTLRWFGAAPPTPQISVLVPLYGRYDFLRYQLALFADDPDLGQAELIYVVDDPRILGAVLELAESIHPLFGLPFAVVHTGRNLGFAGANNLGARVARGERLLLLNSDVMPQAPGWLGATLAAMAELPDAGILGATLLYEDGSVQHAGMVPETGAGPGGFPRNAHPGKGLPPLSDTGTAAQPVAAVTGAFMALRRDLYLELGGLDEGYILGDFEDSDLCERVRQRGLQCYLLPQVRLFHLERQSQNLAGATHWKSLVTLINGWRHERRLAGALS